MSSFANTTQEASSSVPDQNQNQNQNQDHNQDDDEEPQIFIIDPQVDFDFSDRLHITDRFKNSHTNTDQCVVRDAADVRANSHTKQNFMVILEDVEAPWGVEYDGRYNGKISTSVKLSQVRHKDFFLKLNQYIMDEIRTNQAKYFGPNKKNSGKPWRSRWTPEKLLTKDFIEDDLFEFKFVNPGSEKFEDKEKTKGTGEFFDPLLKIKVPMGKDRDIGKEFIKETKEWVPIMRMNNEHVGLDVLGPKNPEDEKERGPPCHFDMIIMKMKGIYFAGGKISVGFEIVRADVRPKAKEITNIDYHHYKRKNADSNKRTATDSTDGNPRDSQIAKV